MRWVIVTVVFGIGIALGVVLTVARSGPERGNASLVGAASSVQPKQLYTCGMHPQVIQDHPGNCPICHMKLTPLKSGNDRSSTAATKTDRRVAYWWDPMLGPSSISDKPGKSAMGMDLVPVYEDQASAGPTVRIDPTIVQNMGVRTIEVTRGSLERTIRTVGMLQVPEPGLHDITLKVGGWIDKLYADTDGMRVSKDQPLFELYSPELQVAEEELIAARRAVQALDANASEPVRQEAQAMVESSKRKLRLWDVSDQDIDAIAQADRAQRTVTLRSPADGHVVEKQVVQGSAVQVGTKLMRIEDHSKLWLDAQVYEEQLPWVEMGQAVTATVDGVPDRTFTGKVTFVYPHVDHMTRTTTVRTMIENPDHELRPGMYATANITARLVQDAVLVPREAVIDTGTRQFAFVSIGEGRFQPRKVRMGMRGDERVQILEGLAPGELVVISGQFLMDVESRTTEAIEKLRGGASANIAESTPTTGETSQTLAFAHCPTKKADWIQVGDAIVNPYYGQQMSDCGEVKRHIVAPPRGSSLAKIIDAYLIVQKDLNADAFDAQHVNAVKEAASTLDGNKHSDVLASATKLGDAKDMSVARAAFKDLSDALIRALPEAGR